MKAFAAGADIKEMCDKSSKEMREGRYFSDWELFAHIILTPSFIRFDCDLHLSVVYAPQLETIS
ncbi:hypothetical protein N9X35_00900 [Amylibacter sp.]|nr:hypothetical protein [Amylibacter sp.]